MKNNKPTALLIIGPSKETTIAARNALMDFVLAQAPADVIIKALDVFQNVVNVNGTQINNCSFVSE